MAYRILLAEDEESLRELIELNLELEGYHVDSVVDGKAALEKTKQAHYNLAILDVMLPLLDGFAVCESIRLENQELPIIFLTAKNTSSDRVLGLKLGADDYLAKPFGMLELVARVKALLRRIQRTANVDQVQFADVVVDFKAYRAHRNDDPIDLSAREYRLLRYLISKQGNVVTRDELLDEVWGYNSYPTTRTVDNHIARLRQKIESNIDEPRHILTVHGVGYKFVA